MERANLVFATVFLALPLLGLLVAMLMPGSQVGIAIASLAWLVTGFVIGLGFVDTDAGREAASKP